MCYDLQTNFLPSLISPACMFPHQPNFTVSMGLQLRRLTVCRFFKSKLTSGVFNRFALIFFFYMEEQAQCTQLTYVKVYMQTLAIQKIEQRNLKISKLFYLFVYIYLYFSMLLYCSLNTASWRVIARFLETFFCTIYTD